MSGVTRKPHRRDVVEDSPPAPPTNTRVDAPHVVGAGQSPSPTAAEPADRATATPTLAALESREQAAGAPLNPQPPGAADSGEGQSPVAIVQQVRNQAAQLAQHLKRQQASLDHREAEINARASAMETHLRNARLWLDEQQKGLDEQREKLEQRERRLKAASSEGAQRQEGVRALRDEVEQELRRREAALEAREAAVAARASDTSGGADAVAALERRLAERESALADCEAELHRLREASARSFGGSTPEEFARRRDHLEAAEAIVAAEQADLKQAREALGEEQAAWRDAMAFDEQRLNDARREFTREVQRKRETLNHRRDELASQRQTLKQLRDEALRAQRESLELRLAGEELWSRLCGVMAPAAVAQSLGELRDQLADQQRLAEAELAEQRSEQQSLAARLAEQQEKLVRKRAEFQSWMARRVGELDERAQALAAREQRLATTDQDHRRLIFEHNEERRAYQQEVRRLLRELRRNETAA